MKIKSYKRTGSFMYLWLKSVTGVDLTQHCAKCLLGTYDNRIDQRTADIVDLELSGSIYYLCGVARPYNWSSNFHLAFEPCGGSTVTVSANGIDIVIEDAVALPIDPRFIDTDHPKARFKTYHTCRNWQFAHYLNSSHRQ